ncbi:probable ATP-dependent DNA helicase HFM1 [Protobothrops mucrosquamatus]|uniref:probable ATP-dependent DNA helicase HFM1 n=1 Tax=Protobothrops mucrosquamatus TaxID=103944 RepID=UPI0010FB9C4F|nr:probable ATP-dependent DNA helicase HFM1 [Protobothrops mucrosquamatus]
MTHTQDSDSESELEEAAPAGHLECQPQEIPNQESHEADQTPASPKSLEQSNDNDIKSPRPEPNNASGKIEMDTYCNIIKNKEMKKDLWKNNVQKVQNSDFNYLSINNIFSASTNTKEIKKAPRILENSSMEVVSKNDSVILRPVTEIPSQFRNIFKEFPYFNYIQSKALDDLLYTDRNFVICAPTGSGKTVMFELAVTRLLIKVPIPWLNIKIVYMAPIKALCSQRFDDWKLKFGPIGLICKELTGDTAVDDLFEIQHAHIILTTPEKWDSMTRKWRDNSLVQLVRLILIDEVHVVKDESRGATLEVVVSRMKTIQSSFSQSSDNPSSVFPMRFVAVSATIPNAEDIAEWLSDGKRPAVCLKIDERHRPVKLHKVVLGFPCSSNQTAFKFDLTLNYKVASVIQTYSEQKPALVFCATRKGVQQAASVLAKDAKFIMTIEQKQRLQRSANLIKEAKLRDLLICGVAYHHAGVEMSDRKTIETAFNMGDIPVLFTTSTLAMGVNLPAHLVVIKSTMHYAGGMFQEYSETDILQMIGRAGRPQFDTTATAVIMTRLSTRDKYVHMLNGADTIESSLHKHLIEHLNAEIVLHTITDVNIALEWVRSTFLYIRALKNPAYYGFSAGLDRNGIEAKLQELCLKNLNDLSSLDLIKMDDNLYFKTTETGRQMAWYYIAFDTVKKCFMINGTVTLSELVVLISGCSEFSDIKLRTNEKKVLNSLNKDKKWMNIRYPMEGKIKTREMKVNCLIQAQLGCIPIQDFTLTQDIGNIFRNGIRLTKWLSEFLATRQNNFIVLLNALILAKCFRCRLWENSLYISKQLEKIGMTLSNTMMNAGLTSFKKIEDINARELELILNRHPPFGNQIKESVVHLPKYELNIEQLVKYNEAVAEIIVTIILTNFEQLQIKRTAPDSHYATLVIGDNDNNVIFRQRIMDSALLKTGNWTKKIEVRRAVNSDELNINLISSEYVGLDVQQKYKPFYLGPKKVGIMITRGKPDSSQTSSDSQMNFLVIALLNTVGFNLLFFPFMSSNYHKTKEATCSQESVSIKNGNRKCNHHCKNKETCGHDCCKIGVSEKSNMKNESVFSSYLTDLRNRNAESAIPPVKRLKMQMSNKSQKVDLKQFSYIPKAFLPALPRLEHVQHPRSPLAEDIYSSDVSQRFQLEPEVRKMNGFFAIKQSEENNNPIMSSNKSLEESSMSNLTDADKSISLFSETLNINFELGNEIWNDYDDGSFVHGNPFTANIQKLKDPESSPLESRNMCMQNLRKNSSFCQNTQNKPPGALVLQESGTPTNRKAKSFIEVEGYRKKILRFEFVEVNCSSYDAKYIYLFWWGFVLQFRLQEEYNPPENLKMAQLTANSETALRSYQIDGKGDFFITSRNMTKGADLRQQLEDDGDIKPFLGIFDGLF